MLIEVKAKVARVIDAKTRKRTETFIVDREFFSEAEYLITAYLTSEQQQGVVESFEILSLRQAPIKEVATQFNGEHTFLATLKDIYIGDDHEEKPIKYRVLLFAENPTQALSNTLQLAREGYDMQIEGIKQVDWDYLMGVPMPETTDNTEEETQDEQD